MQAHTKERMCKRTLEESVELTQGGGETRGRGVRGEGRGVRGKEILTHSRCHGQGFRI